MLRTVYLKREACKEAKAFRPTQSTVNSPKTFTPKVFELYFFLLPAQRALFSFTGPLGQWGIRKVLFIVEK